MVLDRLIKIATTPVSLRAKIMRRVMSSLALGSYVTRLHACAVNRPWYGWCLYYAALEAKALGHRAMTAIEMGVAGGNGLLCLCDHRDEIEKAVGIQIHIIGIDTGCGLPRSNDARDLLYCWPAGSFEMDQSKLRQRIGTRADLIIGDAKENLAALNFDGRPLGAVMFDLDYYTSTRDALPVLTGNHTLPRMWCYLDDIDGYPENCYVDAIGVRAAVSDFNRQSSDNQVSRVYCFQGLAPEEWHARIYACHRLAHPDYNRCPERGKHQLPLE